MEVLKSPYIFNKTTNNCSSKVKFDWDSKSIEWYLESEKKTDFYKRILEEIYPFIIEYNTLLDIGCGTCSFAIEAAKKGFEVTAIDKSPLVIKVVEKIIKQMGLTHIRPVCTSFEEFPINNYDYDVLFISYMMGLVHEGSIDYILKNANKLILVLPFTKIKCDFSINELYNTLGINIKNLEQMNYLNVVDLLKKRNKEYIMKKIKVEFGQYFETLDEAVRFIFHYFKIPIEKRNETENWLSKKLINLNDKLYLPNTRESMIIII